MDYKIKRQGMICASADAQSHKYRKVKGKSGKTWYVSIDSPARNVYQSPNPEENMPGYKGFRGFGGRTIQFELEDGTIDHVTGPWHSNTDSLYEDTGVDVRNQHITFGVISKGWKSDPEDKYGGGIMVDVLYIDEEPTKGDFDRIEYLAEEIANKEGMPVMFYSQSEGGSKRALKKPTWIEVMDKINPEDHEKR